METGRKNPYNWDLHELMQMSREELRLNYRFFYETKNHEMVKVLQYISKQKGGVLSGLRS